MTPAEYDAWYGTPRGSWIGDTEYRLLWQLLRPSPGASVLDVGCGTGYFTRRLAADGLDATGLDSDDGMIRQAISQTAAGERYMVGDARALPFPDRQFDYAIAVASLCFVAEPDRAVREMARVSRRRVALGLLNRTSQLYARKGRHGGRGAYRGARWDTASEGRALLVRAGLRNVTVRSAVFLPAGGLTARLVERAIPVIVPIGGFLLVTGDVPEGENDRA